MKTLLLLCVPFLVFCQDKPNSNPQFGIVSSKVWTIDDYKNHSEHLLNKYSSIFNHSLESAKTKKDKNIDADILRANNTSLFGVGKRKIVEINDKHEKIYQDEVDKLTEEHLQKRAHITEYTKEWVEYLTLKEAKEKELAAIKKKEKEEKEERELLARIEQKRINDSIATVEYEKRLVERKAMPTSKEYLSWKRNYESLLETGNRYFKNCENLISKYSFRNMFGNNVYNAQDFSSADKKVFNQNLDDLYKTLQEIDNIYKHSYYMYWSDNVSVERSTTAYRLSNYYHSKNRIY